MQRTITLTTTASVALGGLAAGIVLSVAVMQPYRPVALSLPQPEVPKIQACGAEPMDWSIRKAATCSRSTVSNVGSLTRKIVTSSVVAANTLVDDASDLANSTVKNVVAEVDHTVGEARQAVQQAVTTAAQTAGGATHTASIVAGNAIGEANHEVKGVGHTAENVLDESLEVTGEVLDDTVEDVSDTVDEVEQTVSDVDESVDCVLSLGLMTLSGNQVVGCTS